MMTRRAALNLTQEDLAERAGVSLRSVTLWEGGKGEPTLRMLHRIADALSVPVSWILGEDDNATAVTNTSEPIHRYRSRTDRIQARLAELTDVEFARAEPVILGLIEMLISARHAASLGSPGVPSQVGDPVDAIAQRIIETTAMSVRSDRPANQSPASGGAAVRPAVESKARK